MIQTLRNFLRHNLSLKLLALAVAVVIWFMIHDVISKQSLSPLPEERKVLRNVPVLVLGRAAAQREVILRPEQVDVLLKGRPEVVHGVQPSQLTLYVDISNLAPNTRYRQLVQYSIHVSGVQVDSISPRVIEIELP